MHKYVYIIFCLFVMHATLAFSDNATPSALTGKMVIGMRDKIVVKDFDNDNVLYLAKLGAYDPQFSHSGEEILLFKWDKVTSGVSPEDAGELQIVDMMGNSKSIKHIPIDLLAGYTWSLDDSQIAYILHNRNEDHLYIMDKQGKEIWDTPIEPGQHPYLLGYGDGRLFIENPRFLNNGKSIIFMGKRSKAHGWYASGIYEYEFDSKSLKQLEDIPELQYFSISPDGTKIAYIANYRLFMMDQHYRNTQKLANTAYGFCSWSPDSKQIVFGFPRFGANEPGSNTAFVFDAHMIDIQDGKQTVLFNKENLAKDFSEPVDLKNLDWSK